MTINSLGLPNGVTFGNENLTVYDEGTWTPVPAVGANTGWAWGVINAAYVRIGKQVTVTAYIIVNTKGPATGDFTISGLPFPTKNVANGYQGFRPHTNAWLIKRDVTAFAVANTSALVIRDVVTAVNVTDTSLTTASDIIIQFTYIID